MSTLADKWNQTFDKIKEQEWYQQLQGSYQQMPPEQQKAVRIGSIIVASGLFLYFSWTMFSNANQAKTEYFEQQELMMLVNQAGDEIRRLKGQNAGFSQATNQNWKQVFAQLAGAQGVPVTNVDVSKETPGASQAYLQETLVDVIIRGIQLRPLVQMLFQIEHGPIPMKIRALNVESPGATGDGNLTVKLSVSGFSAKGEKK